MHKVTQPEDHRATPESRPVSANSPLSPFLLLADTRDKMRKYSMEDELTSEEEFWKTDLQGLGGSIFFPFSVCMKQCGPVRSRYDKWLAHTIKTRTLHLLTTLPVFARSTDKHTFHLTFLFQHVRGQR